MSDDSQNPYASTSYHQGSEYATPVAGGDALPTFCKVMFIIDLVFVGLRTIAVLFGIVGLLAMAAVPQPDPMVEKTGVWEVLTGGAMVVTGLIANIMMLRKMREGVYVAALKVLATIGTYVVVLWQASFVFERFPDGSPEQIGAYVGAIIVLGIRVILLIVYIAALVRFFNWTERRSSALHRQW